MNNAARCTTSGCGRLFQTWLLLALFGLCGCRKEQSTSSDNATALGQPTVGVTLLTMQHQFYQDLRAGLEAEAAARGIRLVVTSAEFDSSRQANQIDEFLVQGVAGLIVCPCDSRSVGASIVAANRAHVPVVTADIASTSPLGEVAVHVASDNVQGGRRAAELMAKALGGKGQVAILSHPEVASVTDRVTGFREGIGAHAGIAVIAELSADGKRDKAARVMEDLLQAHADLAGVFCINDDTALGALAAIESAGLMGKIKIIGYDATPEARAKIASGAIYGDVIQHPREIGARALQALADVLAGASPPAVIPIDVGTFTAESASGS